MGQINEFDSSTITEAIIIWTGWGECVAPCRKDFLVIDHFGSEAASKIIPIIKNMEDIFYSSNAKFTADNLAEMERISSEDFRSKCPGVPEKIVKAFAWCYTFDYK